MRAKERLFRASASAPASASVVIGEEREIEFSIVKLVNFVCKMMFRCQRQSTFEEGETATDVSVSVSNANANETGKVRKVQSVASLWKNMYQKETFGKPCQSCYGNQLQNGTYVPTVFPHPRKMV